MKKRLLKKLLVRAFLVCLCAIFVFTGCDKEDADIGDNNADIGNDGADSSVQAGNMGDEEDFEAPDNTKRVALTFDDGPHNVRTQAIVDELAKYGYHATFFVVGNRVDGTAYGGGKTIPYIIEKGNEIGIHGYTHEVYYHNCDDETYEYELSETAKAIHKYVSDYDIKLMRPIGGNITSQRVAESDYAVIMWNVDSEDWKYKYSSGDSEAEAKVKVNTIVHNVMSQVEDGSIILMHDIYESTYDAVKIILERLHEEGYEVVTVSELLGGAEAGVKYSKG